MAKRACLVRQASYPYDLLFRREAEALRDGGFEVDVICQRFPGSEAEEVIDGVHVHRLPIPRRKGGVLRYVLSYIIFFFSVAFKLTALHLRHPYAVIQVNTMPDFLVFATLIPRLLGARVGLFMYEPMPELWDTLYHNRLLVKILEVIQRLAIGYAHAVFSVTEQQKQTFVARGANPDKITVILNVPDTRIWERFVSDTPSPNQHFTLICHGAIEERYGHDTMLQALQRIRGQVPRLRLHILGTGNYLDEFLAQVKVMDLEEQVRYLGWVSLEDMVRELEGADAGIVAQKSSPYSNLVHTGKMYDYLSFGKPVLASRLRAVQAYFDEEALCFFDPGDPETLAEGILTLYQDSEKRKSFIESSQRLYDQYEWTKHKEIYLSVYHTLSQ